MPTASPSSPRRRRRWGRLFSILFAASLGAVAALWVAVHTFDWAGPLVANTLRSLIGVDNVAKLEDFVYGIEDRVNRLRRSAERPQAYWAVPSQNPTHSLAQNGSRAAKNATGGAGATELGGGLAGAGNSSERAVVPDFRPKDVGPMHKSWSAPGDGEWVPLPDPAGGSPRLWKTLLHPDESRSWAELFVVAIDLRAVKVHLVAGSKEPQANNKAAESYQRLAKVPESEHSRVLAAFNGGFMTEHGGWGMFTDGVTIVTPRDNGCALFAYKDGRYSIGTFSKFSATVADAIWYRQGPECMVENGKLHPGLLASHARKWGATLDGETVIRRSAVALDESGKILYFAITNHTTAPVLARGMLHVGAPTVLQMDVNWSYPKFVLFERNGSDPKRLAVALAPGFEFSEDEYLRKRSIRDFFYVTPLGNPSPQANSANPTIPQPPATSANPKGQ
ncbi:MAG: phosphodiester glycosidase family protein [Polyangiaceae bacterium]|nr:phosphodiester glycosidase family protein [Polyangiaceae bacterium]